MSRENQFHSNQAEMWLKVVHIQTGAVQQSLLLGTSGTFPRPRQPLPSSAREVTAALSSSRDLQPSLFQDWFSLMLNQVKIRIVTLNEDGFWKCRAGGTMLLLICIPFSVFPDYSNCERGSFFSPNNTVLRPFKIQNISNLVSNIRSYL